MVCVCASWCIAYVWNNTLISSDVNTFGAEARIFQDNDVNAMAADALAPYITRTPAAMILTIHDERMCSFEEEDCQLPATYQCRGIIANAHVCLCCLE